MAQSDLYNTEVEDSEPDFSFDLKPTEVGGKPLKQDSEPTFFGVTDLEEPVERNETALQDVGTAVKKGVVGLGQMASGIGALYRYPTQNISKSLAETQENLSKEFSPEGERQKQIVDSAKGFVPSIGAYLENPRALAMAGAESLPGTILGMGPSAAMAKNIFKEAMQKSLAESASGLAAGTITKQQAATMAREAGKQAIGATSKMALIAPSAAAEGVQTSGMIADQAQEAGRAHSEFSGPAVLGGVTTAGINLASGKMFGDIATDVATGAKTVGAGSKVGKVLKGTATEAGEENLQSGQEQVNTNIALGKENIFEGVPEAMGAGTVLGGAMGGAFGSVGVVSEAIKAIGGDKPNAGIATKVATEALVNNVADPAKVVGQTPDSSTGGVAAGIDPTGEPPKPNTGSGAASRVAKASSTAAPITVPSATTEGTAPSTETTPTTQAEAVPTQTAQPQIEAPTDQTLGEVVPHPEHEGVTSTPVVSLEDQRREQYQKLADMYTNATGAERFTVLRTKSPDSPEYQVASAAHNVAYATKIQDKLSTIADTVSKSEPLKSSQRTQLSSMMANLGVSDTGDVKSNVDAVNSAVANIYDRAAKVYRGEVEAPAVQEAPVQAPVQAPAVQEAPAQAPAKAPAVQEAPAQAPAVQEFVPATPDTPIDFAAQNFAADAVTNNIPTDIDPANNQKANSNFQGIPVAIETPKGSERYWKTPDGLIGGSNTQTAHYGEIPKTEGFDNDPVDVFIPDQLTKEDILNTKSAFIIDQINPETGYFDEHKVVLGVKSADEALALYKSNYDPDWKGAKAIHEMPIDQFKTWVFDKNNTVRPLDPNIPLDPQNEVKNVQSQNATTQETNTQEQVETPQSLVEGTDLSSQTVSEPEEFDEAFAAFEPDSRTEIQSSLFGKLRNLQEAFNKGRAEYAATGDKSSLEGVQTATLQQLSELTDSNTASRLTAYLMDSGFTDGDVYWLDNEDVQRVVNDMSYDKLLSEREAALDSSVNKIEQVNDAIEAKTPKKSRLTPLANDKIAEYADDLRAMASKAGWAEVGGKLLRDANGVAVGRTKWIPNADWYKEVENRLGAQQTVAAVEKAINQQPMTAKEKRAVESMINYLYFTIEENLTETQAVHAEKLTQLYELAKSIDEKLNTNFYDAVLREDALTSDDINEWTGDLYDYYARYSKSDTGGQEVANVETESRSDQPAKNDTGKPVATSRSATIAPAISKYLNGTAVVKVRSAGAEGFRLFVDDVAVADVPEFVIGKEDTTRALLNAYREALVAEGVQLKNDSDLEGVLAHLKSQIAQNSVSQQDSGVENLSEDEARAILVENFGLGINRLFNQGILNFGFPSHLTKAINNKAEGAYVRSEGKAYLNLRVLSKDRLVPVVLHEVGEHYGLLKMIGEKEYRNLLNQIRNLAKIKGSEAERVWNAVKKQYTGIEQEGSDRFVSEVIARLGENNPRLPWYRRLLSKVKAFLIRIGIGRGFIRGTLSENDIHDLLRASLFSSVNSTEDVSTYGAQEQPAYSEDLNDANGISYIGANFNALTQARESGSDGVIIKNVDDTSAGQDERLIDTYITFNPNQIKSATGNTGAFNAKNNDIRYSIQPVDNIFEMRRQPLFDSTVFLDKLITAKEAAANFYSDVKSEGYRKALTNAVFSKTTAALGVYRMTDSVKHVLPGLKKFQDLIDTRRGFIDKLMHDFNYAVDKWGHEELKEHRELLNATMQESTMDDVNASLDWSGVMDASYLRDVADNDVHKFSEIRANQKRTTAYTQASLGNHFGNRILVEARKAGAISSTKYSATFDTEQKALKFLDTIRKIEQDMIVSSGGSDTNAKRKAVHARVKRSYDSLPLKAQAIYELVHAQLERSNRLRLEALEDRISESILEGKRRSAAISSLRKAFESNALKWYYAPLGRFGDYWFYAEMDDGERHFQTFDSQHALDKGVSQFTEDNPTAKLLGQGMKMDALGKDVSGPHTTDAFLTELFTVLQEANLDADTYKQITDEVYQRYLAQLPEISMRHRSQHRTGTRGYEKDQLKSTAFALHHSANQIGNMLYGSKMVDVLKDAVQAIKMAQRDDIFANAERELENLVKFADLVKSHNGSAFDAIEDLKLDRRELKAELKQAKADGLDTEYLEQEIADLDELISFTDSFKDLSIDEIHPAIKKRMGSYKSSLDQAKRLRRLPDELPWARDVVKELALTQQHITAPVSSSLDGVAQNLRGLSYIFTLGFSISSALVNLLQTIVVAIPVSYGYFTQLGPKRTLAMYGEVFKYGMEAFATWNGAKDADGNRSLSEVFRRLESEALDAKSAERYRDLREALDVVKMNGDISRSMTWDLIAYGNEGEHVDTAMQGVGKMMGSLFYGAERINREITFVANYALAREQVENDKHSKTGLPLTNLQKRAKAVSISRELTRDAHGDYSPDSSARMFRGPIAAVALQFKKYPVMMYVMWGKNFMGFMNRNKWQDLPETTPEEIEYKAKRRIEAKQATRTFTALLGAQAAFAGAYSLPLSSTISAAATAVMWTVFQALKALGLKDDDDEDVDFQRWVHVSIAQHFGETAATLVTKGVVNASTPINLSSRTDLSSVFFREPLEDLKGEDLSRYYMSQIFGVAGGVANNVMEGMSQISQGREVRGVEMMLPKFLKDVVKTYRYADEGATSRSGIPVADVGTSELVLQLLGFGSSNLDVAFTERGYAKNAEAQLTDRRTAIKARIVKDIMDGAQPDLEELRGWNKRHPEWPIGSKDIHASIKSKLKHRAASEGRGYEVNPKLDYLYDKYRIRD